MPLYFFDIVRAGSLARDEFGSECADDTEACDLAAASLPDIVRDVVPRADRREIVAKVRNVRDEVVCEARIVQTGIWFSRGR